MPGLPLIFDTDIGSDVDDALALALVIRNPAFDLRAVTTVAGDTLRRAKIARKLLHLAGRDDVPVAAGIRGEQSDAAHPSEGHHEDEVLGDWPDLPLSPTPGVDLLVELLSPGDVELTTVGMQSNLAAALDREPSLVTRIPRVTVMGGLFAPPFLLGKPLSASIDHNLNVDQPAALRSLNAGLRLLYVPVDVTLNAWLPTSHVDRLRKGDALCCELARQIDIETRIREHGDRIPAEYACLLHDPLAVACMVERSFVTTVSAPVTVAVHNGHVRTFIDPIEGIEAEIVTTVNAPAFADWWLEMVIR